MNTKTTNYKELWNEFCTFVDEHWFALYRYDQDIFFLVSTNLVYKEQVAEEFGVYGLPGKLGQHHYYKAIKEIRDKIPYLFDAFMPIDPYDCMD